MAITDKKVSEVYSDRDLASLSDRPNESGLTAAQLKARFDQLPKEVIPKYNDLIDELNDTVLPGKSDVGHTHDDRYYTESETDTLLSGKSNTTHNHDLTYAPLVHNHDDIYYTDDETDTLLSAKANSADVYTQTQLNNGQLDTRYYTETEANALLLAKADKLYATNLVTNGDFSNGTTGWSGGGDTISVVDGKLQAVGTAGSSNGRYQDVSANTTDKLYWAINYEYISGVSFEFYATDYGTFNNIVALNATIIPGKKSGIISKTNGVRFRFYQGVGQVLNSKYDNFLVLNLSAIFGAGKEPSAIQVDNMLSTFPNSWFNGTSELVNIANLAQLKADKTQEAWITPTLQSGWLEYGAGFETVRYMKDQFGFVHLKGLVKSGTVGVVCMTLPAGYRPSATQHIATASNNAFGFVTISNLGVVAIMGGSNVWFSLNNITFKAEA